MFVSTCVTKWKTLTNHFVVCTMRATFILHTMWTYCKIYFRIIYEIFEKTSVKSIETYFRIFFLSIRGKDRRKWGILCFCFEEIRLVLFNWIVWFIFSPFPTWKFKSL